VKVIPAREETSDIGRILHRSLAEAVVAAGVSVLAAGWSAVLSVFVFCAAGCEQDVKITVAMDRKIIVLRMEVL